MPSTGGAAPPLGDSDRTATRRRPQGAIPRSAVCEVPCGKAFAMIAANDLDALAFGGGRRPPRHPNRR